MARMNVATYLRFNWIKLAIISIISFIVVITFLATYFGISSFSAMESFSRKQLLAQMSLYFLIAIIQAIIFPAIYMAFHYFFFFGGGMEKVGQQRINAAQVNVKWSDVIGMETVKKEAWEIVKLLQDRRMLQMIGGTIIKGTLMVGPPGCGKTYLAKAIATEANLPFLSVVGSEFVGIFVGTGVQRMKSLFKEARTIAKIYGGCIIFIDEIDSFARPRTSIDGFGAGISHNATINQFLTELDGLRQKENNIVVIAATNVPEEELDQAIMRAGRFDRKLYVGKPNLEERNEVFRFYLSRVTSDLPLESSVNADILARKTVGFSPSDIENMIREGRIIALRNKKTQLTMKDLSEAYDRVVFGLKSNIQLSGKDKVWVAYHEAGHAIISYLMHPTDDVIKATIIPYRGVLGFMAHRPAEETHIRNKEYWLANIKVCLASYAAEKIKFGTTGSGVIGDFQTAMRCAHNMVWSWGMGKSGRIGDFHSLNGTYSSFMVSEETKNTLNNDAQEILQNCLKEVSDILTEKRDLLEYFAQELLKKEELEYDEIEAIFNKFGLKPLARAKG